MSWLSHHCPLPSHQPAMTPSSPVHPPLSLLSIPSPRLTSRPPHPPPDYPRAVAAAHGCPAPFRNSGHGTTRRLACPALALAVCVIATQPSMRTRRREKTFPRRLAALALHATRCTLHTTRCTLHAALRFTLPPLAALLQPSAPLRRCGPLGLHTAALVIPMPPSTSTATSPSTWTALHGPKSPPEDAQPLLCRCSAAALSAR
jgi:hypothetical protein